MPSLMDFDPHRREVLRLIAAGAAASLAGCSKPDQPIVPAVRDEDGDRAGRTRRYATTLALAGYGRGATALVVDGRPIKLEGSANHPASLGATDLFAETAILDLYDPQRLRAPAGPEGISGWPMLERTLIARLAGTAGEGAVLLTGRVTSPTLLARIDEAKTRLPGLRHIRAEAIDDDAERAGASLAYGRQATMRPRLRDTDVLVLLDADPLGPGPDQISFARGWADRRRALGKPLRTYVIEPSLTQSGICADRRAALHPVLIPNVLLAIAAGLGAGQQAPPLPPEADRLVAASIVDLQAAQGRAIVMVGRGQPVEAHALAAWINHRLAAPVGWIAPVDPDPSSHHESLAGLARDMAAGRVGTLVVLDANPLLHAPPAFHFAEALKRVPLSIAFAAFPDETAMSTTWRAPLAHSLESWGDLRGPDGTASLVQPMIKPLFGGRTALQAIDLIDAGGSRIDEYQRLRDLWGAGNTDRNWREMLVAGVIAGTATAPEALGVPRLVLPAVGRAPAAMIVTLPPSPTLWDGRGATNAWAQECPDPVTRQVWGAGLRLSPADAKRLGVMDQDIVSFDSLSAAVKIVEGQADGVATLPLGHGRTAGGPIATGPGTLGPGADGFRLRGPKGGWSSAPLILVATGGKAHTPRNQVDFGLDGDIEKLYPVIRPGEATAKPVPQSSLLGAGPPQPPSAPQWGMVIDASVCIGCNACVVACQSENNVPAIGPEQIGKGRDMHWLRVDRYAHAGGGGFQPVPCMMCEEAPCEPVCPVEAPVHNAEGLNLQVYNRCVGTRTCQANCPYKVRRFNFLDYAGADLWGDLDAAPVAAQRNPEVTVRSRGVMEKCTYCVQRIETATHEADANGVAVGKVVTACQAACPTQAIAFGDISDAESDVAKLRSDPRHYALLGELGTRPRTTYLAKVVDDGGAA